MARATGYQPLNTPKPVARDIWIIDGPAIRFYGLPFSTRATVVRLTNGTLWVHSPTKLTPELQSELGELGPVGHLIAPNWIHYAYVTEWQAAFPDALSWAAPGVTERAARRGMAMTFDHQLGDTAEGAWEGQIDQMIVAGSKIHREAVFFHRASRTLILTDLIENFELTHQPLWMRPLLWFAGISDPDGRMPPDMRATFDKRQLEASVETMIEWSPERVILAHGRWYDAAGAQELRRAFRSVL